MSFQTVKRNEQYIIFFNICCKFVSNDVILSDIRIIRKVS